MSAILEPRKCIPAFPLPRPQNQPPSWADYCYLDARNRAVVYGAVPTSSCEAWEEVFSFETILSEQDDAALSHGRYTLQCETIPTPRALNDELGTDHTPNGQVISSLIATPSLARQMPCEMMLTDAMKRLAYRDIAATQKGFISPQYRHAKRGTLYCVQSFSLLQLDGPDDMALMVSYVGQAENERWTRRVSEFYDGRFQAVVV